MLGGWFERARIRIIFIMIFHHLRLSFFSHFRRSWYFPVLTLLLVFLAWFILCIISDTLQKEPPRWQFDSAENRRLQGQSGQGNWWFVRSRYFLIGTTTCRYRQLRKSLQNSNRANLISQMPRYELFALYFYWRGKYFSKQKWQTKYISFDAVYNLFLNFSSEYR